MHDLVIVEREDEELGLDPFEPTEIRGDLCLS